MVLWQYYRESMVVNWESHGCPMAKIHSCPIWQSNRENLTGANLRCPVWRTMAVLLLQNLNDQILKEMIFISHGNDPLPGTPDFLICPASTLQLHKGREASSL